MALNFCVLAVEAIVGVGEGGSVCRGEEALPPQSYRAVYYRE